jgi:hypothetical protein
VHESVDFVYHNPLKLTYIRAFVISRKSFRLNLPLNREKEKGGRKEKKSGDGEEKEMKNVGSGGRGGERIRKKRDKGKEEAGKHTPPVFSNTPVQFF